MMDLEDHSLQVAVLSTVAGIASAWMHESVSVTMKRTN